MKRLALFFAGLIMLATAVGAQERPMPTIAMNTVFVSGDGKFEAAPDTALLQFSIAAQESTSENAYKKAADAAERMRAALRVNGVDPKTAELGHYSLQPMYDYRSPKRKVVGFRVTGSVTLKLKDFTKVGPLMQALASIDETDNQSISYTLENMDAAKQKAVEDAFNKAKASAQTVAKAGGRVLGQLAYSSVDTFEQPIPVYAEMRAMKAMNQAADAASAPTAEFSPQKITVTAQVKALFELK